MPSIEYRIMAAVIRISGIRRIFRLPEEKMMKLFRKINRSRCFTFPKDKKAIYGDHSVGDYHCLTIQTETLHQKKAILFFFGGGMCIGPDKGDVTLAVDIAKRTKSDVWFPYYPLCTDHAITETYDMAFRCYQDMTKIYGAENISLAGFSSGAALAIGTALHNNALGCPVEMPRQIIASSPGSVPMTEEEFQKMRALNKRDILLDAAFMKTVRSFMEHGQTVPDYMLSGICGDFRGLPIIHFYYGGDEILSAEAEYFGKACSKAGIPYTMTIAPGMCHCYCFQRRFSEGRAAYAEIIERLR